MINKSSSKTPLFLMELIIVILFFSICSATCMQIFAFSQVTSKKASALTGSVLACQSIAEVYKAENGNLERVAEILDGTYEGDSIRISYTNHWERTADITAPCFVLLTVTEKDTTLSAYSSSEEDAIFSISIKVMEVVR